MKPVTHNLALEGIYTLNIIRPDGTVRKSLKFKNLILNAGLNRLGTGGIVNRAHVGSGSTPPVVTDTALQSPVAVSMNPRTPEHGYQSTAPYFGWTRITYRFAEGTAAGNLSEVGVGWDDGLFSRALIVDSMGDPTTITVLSDEVLDVTYELRLYPPVADVTFEIEISGVSYTCVMRPSQVSSTAWRPEYIFQYGVTAGYNTYCWTGDIGTQFEQPSGTNFGYVVCGHDLYANNSYKIGLVATWDLDDGNAVELVKSVSLWQSYPCSGAWQVSFTPRVPKDYTKRWVQPFELAWTRKAI